MTWLYILSAYLLIMNIIASFAAVIDKKKAIKHKQRISEKALMLLGLLGGAFGEYLTMKTIHHKTLHKKFMIGLPLEIVLHFIVLILIYLKVAQII
ncbi:MAG: DUF1294 domain-containing protein [Eubacteriales bacterium]|nr:DUF1294 domain-containing protein [Eubacteriales bacterium]